MAVPETSIHEHDFLSAGKHEIWFSRQLPVVEPVPVAQRVQALP